MEIKESGKLLAGSLVPVRPYYRRFCDISPFLFHKLTQTVCVEWIPVPCNQTTSDSSGHLTPFPSTQHLLSTLSTFMEFPIF